MLIRGELQINAINAIAEKFWERPLYEISEYAFKRVTGCNCTLITKSVLLSGSILLWVCSSLSGQCLLHLPLGSSWTRQYLTCLSPPKNWIWGAVGGSHNQSVNRCALAARYLLLCFVSFVSFEKGPLLWNIHHYFSKLQNNIYIFCSGI